MADGLAAEGSAAGYQSLAAVTFADEQAIRHAWRLVQVNCDEEWQFGGLLLCALAMCPRRQPPPSSGRLLQAVPQPGLRQVWREVPDHSDLDDTVGCSIYIYKFCGW